MSDVDLIRLAIEEAQKALSEGDMPVGAVITLNGVVIGKGRKSGEDFHLGHAEIQAIRVAFEGKRYTREDNIVIYTTLEPCAMCYGTILHCPIRKVVYALKDPYGGMTSLDRSALAVRHSEKMPEIVSGVMRDAVRPLFRSFFETTKNVFWQNRKILWYERFLIQKRLEIVGPLCLCSIIIH